MRLPRRLEVGLDAKVYFQPAGAKPAAATGCEHRGLVQLAHAQKLPPKAPACCFRSRWDRQLDVMHRPEHELWVTRHEPHPLAGPGSANDRSPAFGQRVDDVAHLGTLLGQSGSVG